MTSSSGRVSRRTKELETSSAKLRESEQRLRLASQAAGFGTYDYDVGQRPVPLVIAVEAPCGTGCIRTELDRSLARHWCTATIRDAVHRSMIGENDTLEGVTRSSSAPLGTGTGTIRWILDRGQLFTDIDVSTWRRGDACPRHDARHHRAQEGGDASAPAHGRARSSL